MKREFTILSQTELLGGLREGEIDAMLSCLGYTVKKYAKGDTVWDAGTPVESLGIVLLGQVQVARGDYAGKRSIVASIPAGGVFGEAFACAGAVESPVSVTAAQSSEILFLRVEKVLSPCENACPFHTTLIRRLVRMLAGKNIVLNEKFDLLSRHTTREKLGAYLLAEYGRTKTNPFLVALNREEMADYLGVDRSAMSRELSRMRAEGLLDYWKNSFKILDFETLAAAGGGK